MNRGHTQDFESIVLVERVIKRGAFLKFGPNQKLQRFKFYQISRWKILARLRLISKCKEARNEKEKTEKLEHQRKKLIRNTSRIHG